jgi:PEGA domain
MPAGHLRTLGVVSLALALGSSVFAPDASAHSSHYRGHPHGHGFGVYPSFAIAVGPGVAPGGSGVSVVGLGLGVGYYPFSVGVGLAVPGAPADPRGSLRTDVPRRETEVFVDGYYAGRVDDFDGSFQKLRLDPGPHVVTLYLEGYRLYEESINSTLGSSIKIRHEMEPLEPGEPVPMRPSAVTVTPAYAAYAPPPPPPSPPAPVPSTSSVITATGGPTEYGVLSVRAQPSDVEFWVDGELWELPPDSDRLSLHLSAGPHELRIAKEGYEPFEIGVEIQPSETEALNVRMTPSPPAP